MFYIEIQSAQKVRLGILGYPYFPIIPPPKCDLLFSMTYFKALLSNDLNLFDI
ncbi:hypothetical protein ES705_13331 [subsurface metagenome]